MIGRGHNKLYYSCYQTFIWNLSFLIYNVLLVSSAISELADGWWLMADADADTDADADADVMHKHKHKRRLTPHDYHLSSD